MSSETGKQSWLRGIFEPLDREQRLTLVKKIESDIEGTLDFSVLMILAAVLASLGLLQGSTAVVIGAMLVAPLMTPLVAAGLAIAQGNYLLFKRSMAHVVLGIVLGLGVSLVLGMSNPGFEPTMEIEARGRPDVLDLFIALISGMLGGYAAIRPKVISSLAGVAIAAALLPPLAVIGIGLTNDRIAVALNSSVLFSTNLVAIILGAAIVFRVFGLRFSFAGERAPKWVGTVTAALMALVFVLMIPLMYQMRSAQKEGQARPMMYPVSAPVRDVVRDYLDGFEGVELISIGRQSVEPESGITIMVATKGELSESFESKMRELVVKTRGRKTNVRIFSLHEMEDG